jgi:hypothetical protein
MERISIGPLPAVPLSSCKAYSTEHREYIFVESMQIPVLDMEYEYEEYRKMGRVERAAILKEFMLARNDTATAL